MYYEINVAQHGRHYFATAPRSLVDEVYAKSVFGDLCRRFPGYEGFEVTLSVHYETGNEIVRRGINGELSGVVRGTLRSGA